MTESQWTDEDRALLLAYRLWEQSLCDGCGQPRARAHHPDNDGHYETSEAIECHACTAMRRAHQSDSKEPVKPVKLFRLIHNRDYVKDPLPDLPISGETPDLWD